jgi:short-subunit dehydrogenase involved in D-alanine esterification of teichoic acids
MVELEILNRKGEQMIKINLAATTTIKQVTELFKTHYKKQVIKIISGNPKNPKPQNPIRELLVNIN